MPVRTGLFRGRGRLGLDLARSILRFARLGPIAALSLFIIGSSLGMALDPSRSLTEYNCRTWTRQNGLPVNGVNAIAQTADGYLYLGTAVGVLRFDGRVFESIDISKIGQVRSTIVKTLTPAKNGGLWVGMENGAFGFYDGREFSFLGKEGYGGPAMNVRSIVEGKDGGLLITAQREVAELTPAGEYRSFIKWSTERQLNILFGFADAQGRLWCGTADGDLYYWHEGKVTAFPKNWEGDALCMAQDREGLLWFGTDKGLKCYTSALEQKETPAFSATIVSLCYDREGTLWIGTESSGLVAYRSGKYSYRTKTEGLVGDRITALLEDREGSLWISTEAGFSQLTDIKFRTLPPTATTAGDFVTAVCASQRGGVWVGSRSGVTYFDGNYKTYYTEAGLPAMLVKRIFETRSGDIYMVSGVDQLVILSGERVVAIHKASTLVVGLAEDAAGVIVSVGGELYRANREALVPYSFAGDKPNFEWILNLLVARDGALLVASEAGLFRIKDGAVQKWDSSDGLIDQRVQGISEDEDGVIWASLYTGIARLKDGKLRSASRRDGLFDDNVYAVVSDHLGSLWVDSGKGIFRINRQAMNDFADGKRNRIECIAYDNLESINTADKSGTQEHVGCRSLDGRIWFPSAKGLAVIDPAHIPNNPQPPPVYVERTLVNRTPLSVGQRSVPAGEGELEFHFNALTFIAPQKARFRYRLDGYDKDWVDAGNRQMAFYTNLKPGNYTFRVTAANADGVWNKEGDSVQLQLLPHFYQTIWFYLLCSSGAGVGLGSLYLWRTRLMYLKQRALQENRDQLETQVRNRTAELANVNLSLQREVEDRKRTAVELVERTKSLEKEIQERIEIQRQIEQVHRSLLDASRQAGMAEIATNVLHNVGNVLNSVNVSSALALDIVRKSSVASLERIVTLMREHQTDLGTFINTDPRGQKILPYLGQLSNHLTDEQANTLKELLSLRENIEHIREIVVMQQSFATASGVKEILDMKDIIEDSLKINSSAMDRHGVEVIRDYHPVPRVEVDKHKILQILVNLVSNAKHACNQARRSNKRVTVRLFCENNRIIISVSDNGMGVSPENLTRIFNHGFTTRKDGHGFGLHSGAIAAREMGGSLTVQSEGTGKGATFIFELPCPAVTAAETFPNIISGV